jgi:hypothetical protein
MTLLIVIIALALIFDYINGFHDAANSIATIVSTKVLTPFQAVVWAAEAALSNSSRKKVSSFFMKSTRSRSCWFEWGDQTKFQPIVEDSKEKVYLNETLSFFRPTRSKSLGVSGRQRFAVDSAGTGLAQRSCCDAVIPFECLRRAMWNIRSAVPRYLG